MDDERTRPATERESGPEGEVVEGGLGDPDAPETAHAQRDDRASTSSDRLAERWPTEDQRRGPPGSDDSTGRR